MLSIRAFGRRVYTTINLFQVTHLVISRPLNFKYQPGDYVFIQVPAIATHEWHPFTISSAPEMEGIVPIHTFYYDGFFYMI